jgi:hypothetical protein
MASLGQTLCQLEKTFLNHRLGNDAEFFIEKNRGKMAKTLVFVARQRQYFYLG